MEYRDYYAALGVDKKASQADIKKAFRKLAREHHPDVNKGDASAEKRFKEVSEANEVLSDPEKRKAYDELGADWAAYQHAGGGAGGARGGGNPFAGFGGAGGPGGPGGTRFEFRGTQQEAAGFSDFFRTFFTGGSAAGAPGARPSGSTDPLFGGLGGDSGSGYAPSGFGTASPRGTARQPWSPPADVGAETNVSLEEVQAGTVRHLDVGGKRLEVKIPPGVKDGQRIRLSGKAGSGGNIYITVHVDKHPRFTRDGADLSTDLPLTLGEALLGSEVTVHMLTGKKLLLTIPPATQNGRVFRLGGQGLPRFGKDNRGDLRVRTSIVMPASLDDEARTRAEALVDHIDQSDPRLEMAPRDQ